MILGSIKEVPPLGRFLQPSRAHRPRRAITEINGLHSCGAFVSLREQSSRNKPRRRGVGDIYPRSREAILRETCAPLKFAFDYFRDGRSQFLDNRSLRRSAMSAKEKGEKLFHYSDSPSTKSIGLRFISAKILIKETKKYWH